MKKAVTFRLDAALLEEARAFALRDNRTLTNYIETILKAHVAAQRSQIPAVPEVIAAAMQSPPTS